MGSNFTNHITEEEWVDLIVMISSLIPFLIFLFLTYHPVQNFTNYLIEFIILLFKFKIIKFDFHIHFFVYRLLNSTIILLISILIYFTLLHLPFKI